MKNTVYSKLDAFFPLCRSIVDKAIFDSIIKNNVEHILVENIPELLEEKKREFDLPAYIYDLSRFELACFKTSSSENDIPLYTEGYKLNPTLALLKLSWKIIPWIEGENDSIEKGSSWAIIWRDGKSGETVFQEAGKLELMALKIAAEGLDIKTCSAEYSLNPGKIHTALSGAASKGIITGPRPLLRRNFAPYAEGTEIADNEEASTVYTFTLNWQIPDSASSGQKQQHKRTDSRESAARILDGFLDFCLFSKIRGHISFSGTSLFSNPAFIDIYQMVRGTRFSYLRHGGSFISERPRKNSGNPEAGLLSDIALRTRKDRR